MNEFLQVIFAGISSVYVKPVALFAIGTATLSFGLCLLDLLSTKLFKTPSLLKIGYGGINTVKSLFFWGLGAGIAAYFGGLAEFFNINSMSSKLVVGVGWPTVLPRILEMADKEAEPEQEEQQDEEEEEEK